MVAFGKELGLEGERLAEYVDRQTQLKLDQDAREEQRKMAAEAEQRKMELEEKKWPPKRQSDKKDVSMNWS